MDIKNLTGVVMKHEGRLGKVEEKTNNVEKLIQKHVNRHFQLTLFIITQTIILISGFIVLYARLK